jgi:hypothetical protein
MSQESVEHSRIPDDMTPKHRARLPRFVSSEPVGLGDVVKKVTTAVGIRPCGACEERAARMNQWLRLEPRR